MRNRNATRISDGCILPERARRPLVDAALCRSCVGTILTTVSVRIKTSLRPLRHHLRDLRRTSADSIHMIPVKRASSFLPDVFRLQIQDNGLRFIRVLCSQIFPPLHVKSYEPHDNKRTA